MKLGNEGRVLFPCLEKLKMSHLIGIVVRLPLLINRVNSISMDSNPREKILKEAKKLCLARIRSLDWVMGMPLLTSATLTCPRLALQPIYGGSHFFLLELVNRALRG